MSNAESNEYILGTDKDELHRLGIQHQVWASEAQEGWRRAGFKKGDVLLDLGSGPGYCSKELAFIAGEKGQVIAVDKSESYIHFIEQLNELHGSNIDARCADFNEMHLADNSLDGMYCRWALAWLANPKEVLEKVRRALKRGRRMVIHEYYDWSTHQTTPRLPGLSKAIAAALQSFNDSEGEIDIGRELPIILNSLGMKVLRIRPMIKLVR
ncbi:MAG: methyltransferase domain-containing protein, partial [Flavobacteriales bacterium]|nr:methyltransferase domain-containing protein [Flavobacteriales bacterium]